MLFKKQHFFQIFWEKSDYNKYVKNSVKLFNHLKTSQINFQQNVMPINVQKSFIILYVTFIISLCPKFNRQSRIKSFELFSSNDVFRCI